MSDDRTFVCKECGKTFVSPDIHNDYCPRCRNGVETKKETPVQNTVDAAVKATAGTASCVVAAFFIGIPALPPTVLIMYLLKEITFGWINTLSSFIRIPLGLAVNAGYYDSLSLAVGGRVGWEF